MSSDGQNTVGGGASNQLANSGMAGRAAYTMMSSPAPAPAPAANTPAPAAGKGAGAPQTAAPASPPPQEGAGFTKGIFDQLQSANASASDAYGAKPAKGAGQPEVTAKMEMPAYGPTPATASSWGAAPHPQMPQMPQMALGSGAPEALPLQQGQLQMMQNQFEQNRQAQIGGMGGMGGMGMRQAPWFPMQQFGGGMPEAMPYRYGGIGYGAYNGYNGPTWGNLGSVSGQFDPFTFNGAIGDEQNWGVANAYAMDNPMAAREEKPRVATAQNLNTNYSPYESTGGA